jgi:hypothetical protein
MNYDDTERLRRDLAVYRVRNSKDSSGLVVLNGIEVSWAGTQTKSK